MTQARPHALVMVLHRSGLHLSEGVFAPTAHPTPTPRPSAPFMLAQHPHIGVLSALLHPGPEPLDALSHVLQSALVSA